MWIDEFCGTMQVVNAVSLYRNSRSVTCIYGMYPRNVLDIEGKKLATNITRVYCGIVFLNFRRKLE